MSPYFLTILKSQKVSLFENSLQTDGKH